MAAGRTETVDLREVIDRGRLGRLQWTVMLLCGLCLILDGFDVQAIGFVAPAIAQEWGVQPAALGVVFAAGLFGMVVGSGVFSLLADAFGRRPMLIAATLLSGAAMLATGHVRTVEELLVMRFVTGVALGSLMPNALALTSEYNPSRSRTAMVMVMACGFTFGAALGGWLTSIVIPTWGWRGVFTFGGVAPLILGVVMIFTLPESLRLMVLRGAPAARVGRLLKQILPGYDPDTAYEVVVAEPNDRKVSPAQLFRDGRAPTTILLWIVGFMGLLDLYFLSNWLPTVIRGAGYPLRTAVLASTMLQVGGVTGTLVMAALVSRVPLRRILVVGFLAACVAIFLVGQVVGVLPALLLTVFVSGFCVVGGQPGLNALAADYYPTFIRSTGVGWMLGVGRFGSIVGPLLGGLVLQMKWGNTALFFFAAVPALVAAIGLWLVGRLKAAPGPAVEAAAVVAPPAGGPRSAQAGVGR